MLFFPDFFFMMIFLLLFYFYLLCIIISFQNTCGQFCFRLQCVLDFNQNWTGVAEAENSITVYWSGFQTDQQMKA